MHRDLCAVRVREEGAYCISFEKRPQTSCLIVIVSFLFVQKFMIINYNHLNDNIIVNKSAPPAAMSSSVVAKSDLLHLYRRLLRGCQKYPSKNRDKILQSVREDFRENMNLDLNCECSA